MFCRGAELVLNEVGRALDDATRMLDIDAAQCADYRNQVAVAYASIRSFWLGALAFDDQPFVKRVLDALTPLEEIRAAAEPAAA
jgi:hypothetical protein